MVKLFITLLIVLVSFSGKVSAAVLHFYTKPSVPQKLFHVTLEYRFYIYEADTHRGGIKYSVNSTKKTGDYQIEIPDELVNEAILEDQVGRKFDFTFTWDNEKTYCSKLVGKALEMERQPMSFAGTHYLEYYPHWAQRNDPGISPDQIFEFGIQHGHQIF